jgi:hypothetical protein
MPIYSDKNLYPGVNAHLNSFLQQKGGGWESFHTKHINDLQAFLDTVLPPNYYAVSEKSLQISEIGFDLEALRATKPDVEIFQTRPSVHPASISAAATPTATMRLLLEDEDDYLSAVVIYEIDAGRIPGNPVTRIELLSPSNKPPRPDYRLYWALRLHTLRSGTALVEIDYLHESRPVLPSLPSYRDRDDESHPYMIIVNNPHPIPEQGYSDYYGFGVDNPLPLVNIPLSGQEVVGVDFGAVYSQTFSTVRLFRMVADYAQDPVNFDRYTEADRAKISGLLDNIRQTYGSQL